MSHVPHKKTKPKFPAYRLHRASMQAIVTLTDAKTGKRRDVYLGPFNSPESREKYDAVIGTWMGHGRTLNEQAITEARKIRGVTISRIVLDYTKYAQQRFQLPDGTHTTSLLRVKQALRILHGLYGHTSANAFGPKALAEVRTAMIGKGWNRPYVNRSVAIIKNAFKRAVANELVEPAVYQAINCLPNLGRGEQGVTEGGKVNPVPEPHIDAVLSHVPTTIAALIELQLLTAARPGELVIMRPIDLDTTSNIWTYTPSHHKMAHRDHTRTIYIGKRGQAIIKRFLTGRAVDAFLFSPAESEKTRRIKQHAERTTPLSCGNKPGSNRKDTPKCKPGRRYTTTTYARAITRACDAAGVPHWTPNQLRHNAATRLRKEFGLDAAQIILGHSSAAITQVYAEADRSKAIEAISKVG